MNFDDFLMILGLTNLFDYFLLGTLLDEILNIQKLKKPLSPAVSLKGNSRTIAKTKRVTPRFNVLNIGSLKHRKLIGNSKFFV